MQGYTKNFDVNQKLNRIVPALEQAMGMIVERNLSGEDTGKVLLGIMDNMKNSGLFEDYHLVWEGDLEFKSTIIFRKYSIDPNNPKHKVQGISGVNRLNESVNINISRSIISVS